MHDAKLGDIYIDAQNKLWRVRGRCDQPMVFLEEVEPAENATKRELAGGIDGLMWNGFKRIWRMPCRHELGPASEDVATDSISATCKLCGETVRADRHLRRI